MIVNLTENLSVTHYRNGDEIPQVTDPAEWTALTTGAWCHYDNNPANEEKYGKLYNWYAVNDLRGLAPTGYHVPSDVEWDSIKPDAVYGGYRTNDGSFINIGNNGNWWSSTEYNTTYACFRYLNYDVSNVNRNSFDKSLGFSVRCVRDVEAQTEISDKNKDMTAVQWLISELQLYYEGKSKLVYYEIIQQAKEMEREQLKNK